MAEIILCRRLRNSVIARVMFAVFLLLFANTGHSVATETPYAFEVERLNLGLKPAAKAMDRDTPQGTLETFLSLGLANRFNEAAHTLDLSGIDIGKQSESGPELARKLLVLLERQTWLGWRALPDRPDGVLTKGDDNPLIGQKRRSFKIATMARGEIPVPIRLNRMKERGSDPVWVFSSQTVENIGPLFDLYGERWFDRLIPRFLKTDIVFGLERWEVVAAPTLFLAAALAGFLVFRFLNTNISGNGPTTTREILSALALPAAIATGAATLYLFVTFVISFNGILSQFIQPLTVMLFVLALGILFVRIADTMFEAARSDDIEDIESIDARSHRDFYTNVGVARRVLIVIIFLVGAGIVFLQSPALENFGLASLGGASVLALILGYAGREVLSNIMSSLQIAVSKSARIGDVVRFKGEQCTVERIDFTYLTLRTWDGRRLIAPVNDFVSNTFENWSKRDPSMQQTITLVLDHRCRIEPLREAFLELVENDDRMLDDGLAAVQIMDHDQNGYHARFKFNAKNPDVGWAAAIDTRAELIAFGQQLEQRSDQAVFPVHREFHLGEAELALQESDKSKS